MLIWKGCVKRSKFFITGIGGFAGSYLAGLLVKKEAKVYGLLAPGEKTANIRPLLNDIELEKFDILNGTKLTTFIKKIKPDYVMHLAAFASVGKSFEQERLTYDINFTGTLNLLEAALRLKKSLKKLIFVSSSDVYGHFKPHGRILKESQPLSPVSPYAVSKAAGEFLVTYHYRKHGLPSVIIRSFNHTGPGQADNFAVPSFCRQIAEIEKGFKKPVVLVGDLSARRDLSDVRDIVRGYYLAARKGKSGEIYQLCSGRSVEIKAILEKLLKLSDSEIKVKKDKSRFRKTDIPVLRGDCSRAERGLGWKRQYNLDTTLRDTLAYWRMKIKS